MLSIDKRWTRILAMCALSSAFACGKDEELDGAAAAPADAGTGSGTPTGGMPGCSLPALLEFDTPLANARSALVPLDAANPTGPKRLTLLVRLLGAGETGNEATGDYLAISLIQGRGPYAAGFVTGTYPLTGENADGNTCSSCVFLFGDANLTAGTAAQEFVASGGTLDISSIDITAGTGSFNGSLSNVTLREVTVNNDVQADVPDGCAATVPSFQFASTPTAPAGTAVRLGGHALPLAPVHKASLLGAAPLH